MELKKNEIWLIGTGLMGVEHARVLKTLDKPFLAIGRGEISAKQFEQAIGVRPIVGGLEKYLSHNPNVPKYAIIAVGIESLTNTALKLLDYGVKNILIEKPGIGYPSEIDSVLNTSIKMDANVFIAYNRRFYSSVIKAKEIIDLDGGVTSFNFEFTEWSHIISTLPKLDIELRTWFLCNSTHVIDTAFFLCGKPKQIFCFHKGGLPWHPAASIFTGSGISENGALFSYQANWESPGRWFIEICTSKHRIIFKPLEKLKIQNIGSVEIEDVIIDDDLDVNFKPGFYLQLKSFLENDFSRLCSIQNQADLIKGVYNKMSGY